MSGFAQWIAQRRFPRVLLIGALFPLGLLSLFSVAAVVMTALLKGWRAAMADCAMAGGALLLVALVAGGQWQPLLGSAVASWGLAILLGALTGRYASLLLAVQVLLVVVCGAVIAFTLAIGDPVGYWQGFLVDFAAELSEMGVQVAEPEALALLAPLMTGLVAASAVSSSLLALVIGAWWAGDAGGPGLGEMFVRLRLGRVVGLATAILGLLAAVGIGGLPGSLLLVLGTGFAVQGLAVAHWQARARNWPRALLVLLYLPLMLGPSVAAVAWFCLASLGFVDNWYSLRRRDEDVI